MKRLQVKLDRTLGEFGLGVSFMRSISIGHFRAFWVRLHLGPWTLVGYYVNSKSFSPKEAPEERELRN